MKSLKFRAGAAGLFLSILTMPWLSLNATWQPPEVISNPAAGFVFVGGDVLVMNPQGNALVIFPGDSLITFQRSIWTNFYVRGIGWQGPQVISDQSFNTTFALYISQGDPDVALNSSNYAIAAWEGLYQDGNFPEVVISTYRQPNGIWAPVTNVSDASGDFYALNANVALNEAGTGVVVYRTGPYADQTVETVMASILPLGGAYSTPVQISDVQQGNGNLDTKPSVAINDAGDIAVVWYRSYANGDKGIDAATYNALTATWSPTIHLDLAPGFNQFDINPRVVIDPAGYAVAVWRFASEIRSSVFTPGSGWAAYQVVANGASPSANPAIVTDKSGNVTITYAGFSGGMFGAYKPFGGAWSAPQVISADPTADQFPFMSQKPLAIDPDGNVMTIFQINNSQYQTSYRLVGQPWSIPENLDMGPATSNQNSFPNVGLASCGFAAASFMDDANELVLGEVNENFFAPFGLSRANCTQKFATQKVNLDILSWLPFTDCILFYNVYCNGFLIASIPGSGPLEFVNPTCNNCTYTLTTTNIWGFESDPVPFSL